MGRRNTSVARALLVFVLSGLLVLLLVGTAGVLVLRRLGTAEAVREAENLAVVTAQGIIEPRLFNGIVRAEATSMVAIDSIVKGAVLRDPIVRVLIWSPQGKILYSDNLDLVDSTLPLSEVATETLDTGQVASGQSDSSLPQNRLEDNPGQLLEVVVPVETPDGHRLLFEALFRSAAVQASGIELWGTFLPILAVALLAFAALQIPLAYRLARQVRDSQLDREQLLQRAIDASDLERRRITSDLHDGLVQEFAGLAMSLSASADTISERDPQSAEALREASTMVRQGMHSLRSAVMGIYPPTLHRAGLPAALSDLVAPLEAQGIRVRVEVDQELDLPAEVERMLFRCAQESVRNIISHSDASEVTLGVSRERRSAVLTVVDDGAGFSSGDLELARADGHAGLRLMDDLARDAGGRLELTSEPGLGTTVRLEVPR